MGPPWKLTVHFGDFPEESILKCFTRDTVESQFMSCVKEADQFKHGGRIMSTMQKKEHNQLWLGLANGELILKYCDQKDDRYFKLHWFRWYIEGEQKKFHSPKFGYYW